jgi:hypothetical protein
MMAVRRDFKIIRSESGYLFFEDRKYRTNYSLYYIGLSSEQILTIARIIDEVYSFRTTEARSPQKEIQTVGLNSSTESSRRFVSRVLNLDGSAVHKFFLLTSGANISSLGEDDLLITLAEVKSESCRDESQIFRVSRVFQNLQEVYIFPGITDTIGYRIPHIILDEAITRHSLETISKLLAFISNEHPDLILKDYLQLENKEAFKTVEKLRLVDVFSFIEEFMARNPGYSKIVQKLTLTEIHSISLLMDENFTKIPADFLSNRVIPMARISDNIRKTRVLNSYLSPREIRQIGPDVVEEINDSLRQYKLPRRANALLIYSAIAELLAYKDRRKTLDVIHELKHLFNPKHLTSPVVEATVLLILEASVAEDDAMPFSWVSQLSEHSWVMSSHVDTEKELAEML